MQPMPLTDFPYDKIANGNQYQWRSRVIEEWFYDYEQYTIWGLTARILKHFIDTLNRRYNRGAHLCASNISFD